jgi:hypothetical protein
MVVPIGHIRRFSPIVYLPKEESERQLIGVLCEIADNYAILWFHWPRDGYFQHPDYEPVILVFRNDVLHKIGIRPHRKYKSYDSWKTVRSRPVIVFEGPFHRAIVAGTGMGAGSVLTFYSKLSRASRLINYDFKMEKPPPWFYMDDTNVDVRDYANDISS